VPGLGRELSVYDCLQNAANALGVFPPPAHAADEELAATAERIRTVLARRGRMAAMRRADAT
jgi:hypothetical protein